MVQFVVKDNIRQFRRTLRRDQRRNLPKAVAGALNDTLFGYRQHTISRVYPSAFKVRNKSFARAAFRVRKATVRKPVGAVFDRLNRTNLELHAEGGTKRARAGHIAVPVGVKRTASGRVPKGKTPRALLGKGAFRARLRTGNIGIVTRSRGGKIEVAYTLIRRAPIRPRFKFQELGERYTRWRFPINLRKRMARQLKTVRR